MTHTQPPLASNYDMKVVINHSECQSVKLCLFEMERMCLNRQEDLQIYQPLEDGSERRSMYMYVYS